MYVSTAQVLRRFAQKVASRGIRPFDMDAEELAAHEAYMASKAEKAKADAAKPVAQKPGTLEQLVSGARDLGGRAVAGARNLGGQAVAGARDLGGKALDTGKALGGAVMENPGYAAMGAGGGAAALYGLARMLQSEEDRKKRQPVVAPALGAVGGAVALPALMAALSKASPAAGSPPTA